MAQQLDGHIDAQVDSRILLPFDADYHEIFSSYDPDGASVYNTDCWAYDFDMTGICHSGDSGSPPTYTKATAITPRHAIQHAHAQLVTPGDIHVFHKQDGTRVPMEVESKAVADWPTEPDFEVMRYTTEFPADVAWYKILPTTFASFLTAIGRPLVAFDYEEHVFVHQWIAVDGAFFVSRWTDPPLTGQRLAYAHALVTGDSGAPCFIPVNGELLLLGVWTGAASGSFTTLVQEAINGLIVEADTTVGAETEYTLTEYDLASPSPPIINAGYFGLLGWVYGWLNSSFVAPVIPDDPTKLRRTTTTPTTIRKGASSDPVYLRHGPEGTPGRMRR